MPKPEKQVAVRDKRIPHDKVWRILRREGARIHFIGAFGVSVRSLIKLTLSYGTQVSASDRELDESVCGELTSLGADIYIGHEPRAVEGASLVVYSLAIHEDDPELHHARELDIPAISRSEYLGVIMSDYASRIGVSGTHGKSTVTAMLDAIFAEAAKDPTTLSGSLLPIGDTMRHGGKDVMIYEACEYKDSFLRFSPTTAIALNLELDHTDYFKDISELCESFRRAMSHATVSAIINADDRNLSRIITQIKTKTVTFSKRAGSDYRYVITGFLPSGYEFEVLKGDESISIFRISIPGSYNVTNAAAAVVCALEYGIEVDKIKAALESFGGISRRLEYLGDMKNRPVYYDYAHHPTAIAAVISAVKMLTHERITVIFKPHTYSRTKSLWDDFRRSLMLADHVILTDIYAAREEAVEGVCSERLAHEIGDSAVYCADTDVAMALDNTSGAIIIMGAGDMRYIKDTIVEKIRNI